MTTYPYQPPERMYQDTMLAFIDFQMASTWSALVEPDPLGPVNKIVTLMRGERRVRSVLGPVPAGATVKLVRDSGGYTMEDLAHMRDQIWNARGRGRGENPMPDPHRPRGWRIEVDGETVLAVTDAELRTPYVPPRTPFRQRVHRACRDRWQSVADRVAGRLGHHRSEDCAGWDE